MFIIALFQIFISNMLILILHLDRLIWHAYSAMIGAQIVRLMVASPKQEQHPQLAAEQKQCNWLWENTDSRREKKLTQAVCFSPAFPSWPPFASCVIRKSFLSFEPRVLGLWSSALSSPLFLVLCGAKMSRSIIEVALPPLPLPSTNPLWAN